MAGLGPHDGWRLRLFGAHVAQAFGETAYHVGSSLAASVTGEKGRVWRDVDVRLLLDDEHFARLFGDPHDDDVLRVWSLAASFVQQLGLRGTEDFSR